LNEPTDAAESRRPRFRRGGAYFLTWLLSAFALIAAGLFDYCGKRVAGTANAGGLLGAILFGGVVAVLSLPILFLLRVVPEPSPSSGVRLFRRVLLGFLCGLLLAALLSALIAAGGKAEEGTTKLLAPVGAIFGVIAGVVDSIALDARSREPARDADDSNAA